MECKKITYPLVCLVLSLLLAAPAMAVGEAQGGTGGGEPLPSAAQSAPDAASAQDYVVAHGLMTESELGFEPDRPVTKAMLLQALYNLNGQPQVKAASDAWFARAAAWARSYGLTETLRQDVQITAEQAVGLLRDYCILNGVEPSDVVPFDADSLDDCMTRAQLAEAVMALDMAQPAGTETDIQIAAPAQDGIPAHTIPGTLCVPAGRQEDGGEQRMPAVVILHGTNNARAHMYESAAAMMAKEGIVTLRIDFMGCGKSTASYKDYNFTSATIDAKAAADYLAGLDYVDPMQITVLGFSQGGTNALLAAARCPDSFHGVITWSGALDLTVLYPDSSTQSAQTPAMGSRWYQEIAKTNILWAASNVRAPALIINGSRDTVVPCEHAASIARVMSDAQLHIIPGASHTYNLGTGDLSALFEAVNASIDFVLGRAPDGGGETDGPAPA